MKVKEITFNQYNIILNIIPEYGELPKQIFVGENNLINFRVESEGRLSPYIFDIDTNIRYPVSAVKVLINIPEGSDFFPTFEEYQERIIKEQQIEEYKKVQSIDHTKYGREFSF